MTMSVYNEKLIIYTLNGRKKLQKFIDKSTLH